MRRHSAFYANCRTLATAGLFGLAVSGCSSLFYQPTRAILHFDPTRHGVRPVSTWIATEDGKRLHAWVFKPNPDLFPQGPRARIVFFHGNAQNLTAHSATLLWVLELGYEYMIFDYRGYGLSEGSPSQKGTWLDSKAALKWATLEKPSAPLIVLGQSLGGAIALRAVGEWGCEFGVQGITVDSTFASYVRVSRRLAANIPILWPFQWITSLIISDAFAPEPWISQIAPIPLLVLHGDQDRVVTLQNGQEVFEIAKDPKEFWPVPGGQHIDAFWRKDEPTYRALWSQWLQRRVSSPPPKCSPSRAVTSS